MELLPKKFTGKTLLQNEKLSRLYLRYELKKLNLLTAQQLKHVPDEIIIWDDESKTVAYLNTSESLSTTSYCDYSDRTVDSIHTRILSLFSAQHVVHDVSDVKEVKHHVEISQVKDSGVKFYETKDKNCNAFLVINSLWLAVPAFQALLNNNLDKHAVCENLTWDSKRQYFVPAKKRTSIFSYTRNSIRSGDVSLNWNASIKAWDATSRK